MRPEPQLIDLSPVARRVTELRAAPGAAAAAAVYRPGRGWLLGSGCAGRLASGPAAPPVTPETLFDLASVTKPLTALTLARCERAGLLSRQQQLAELLPALGGTAAGQATLDLLCSHRAGLEAHREYFVAQAGAVQPDKASILAAAADARRPECRAGEPPFPPVYSDLGYILVGEALAAAAGLPLDELVERETARPLGLRLGSLRRLRQGLSGSLQIAATEDVAWRGGVLCGQVHDENAWVLAGLGSAGHAGLFGDAGSLARLGTAVLDGLSGRRDDWLTAPQIEPLVRRRPGGSHCAGFDRRAGPEPMSGRWFSSETFGHLGFTGTSIWLDPPNQLVGVLLTNRVHPSREHQAIRQARPAAYDLLFELMMQDQGPGTKDQGQRAAQ